MRKSRMIELKTLSETKYLNLYDAKYSNKRGNENHWIIASRKNTETLHQQYFENTPDTSDAVVIVAFHEIEKKLVLLRQFRVPLNDYVYELPAGLIDTDFTTENTVTKELFEETGLMVTTILDHLGRQKVYLSAGMTDESVDLVYCLCKGEITNENLEEDEEIEAFLLSREEAAELLNSNIKMDIKAYMTLQSFVSMGEKMFELN